MTSGGAGPAADPTLDPWAAASAADAVDVEAQRALARERRAAAVAARQAADQAARRVAEAAALAAAAKAAATDEETSDTGTAGAASRRTSRGLDVWAAATAAEGVAGMASPTTVDHDVPGAAASGERDGAAGDAAPGDGAA